MVVPVSKLANVIDTCPGTSAEPRPQPVVLVTEDDEDLRFMLRTFLNLRGCQVLEAVDGAESVEMAEREQPDLILMDGSLPRLDGLAATRVIRERGKLSRVPIIIISGHAEPAFRAVALEAGCDEYLLKPFDFDCLDDALERHLGKEMRVAGK